jgi:hypothetical protein
MIAHEHAKLHAWTPPTPQQREIARLLNRRATLISLREAVAMSLNELDGFAADLKVCIPTERDRGFRRMMTAESDDVDR